MGHYKGVVLGKWVWLSRDDLGTVDIPVEQPRLPCMCREPMTHPVGQGSTPDNNWQITES